MDLQAQPARALALPGRKVTRARLASRVLLANPVWLVSRGRRVIRDPRGLKGRLVRRAKKAIREPTGRKALKATTACQVSPERRVILEKKATQESPESQVYRANKARRVSPASRENKARKAIQARRARRGTKAILVSKDLLGPAVDRSQPRLCFLTQLNSEEAC